MMLDALSILLALLIAARLLFFRRSGLKFKRHVSMLAWVLTNCCVLIAVLIAQRGLPAGLSGWLITLALALAAYAIYRAKGNVAAALNELRRRTPWPYH